MTAHLVHHFVERFGHVPGWYSREHAAMGGFFLGLTRFPELGMIGDLAEVGVYEGRSAAHLALHLQPGERLHLSDPYERMPQVAEYVQGAACEGATVVGHRGFSQLLDEAAIPSNSCRYIRIDGNHTRRAVRHDMDLAHRILRANGVINLDDFFHPTFAGVTYAVFEWMAENRGAFELLLVGMSQGFLCRPSFINHYMHHMRGLPDFLRAAGVENFSLTRASSASDCLAVGITHRQFDRDWLLEETDYGNVEGPEGRRLVW
jgi:hypothetical protein